MKVFIIESSSPLDLMNGVSESKALEEICKMMQHSVTTFFAKSLNEFQTIIDYISSINDYAEDDDEICIHLSCHGNSSGLAIGNDFIDWEEVAKSLSPLYKMNNIESPIYLAISACGTNNLRITSTISKMNRVEKIKPPKFIFVIDQDEVQWNDALLNWTILYHQIDNLNLSGPKDIRNLLERISDSGFGKLKYYRWDSKVQIYKFFNGTKTME